MSAKPSDNGGVAHSLEMGMIGEGHPVGLPHHEVVVPAYLHDRPTFDIPTELSVVQEQTGFKASHGQWRILKDIVGLVRRGSDGEADESYEDKLSRELRRGKSESATYGLCEIVGEKAVLYAMNWDFFAGSLGVVAGEKFQAASDLARSKKLPFVSIYASSGARQHENSPGLVQMTRLVDSIRRYKKDVNHPQIAVLLGNVWGGVSASAVPVGDMTIAVAGTNFGFAGPNVIEAFEGRQIPLDAQSAEENMISRNIDAIVPNSTELISYLGRLLHTLELPDRKHRISLDTPPQLRIVVPPNHGRVISFGKHGLAAPNVDAGPEDSLITIPSRPKAADQARTEALFAQYNHLISGADCVDLEFLLQNTFTDAVPLYNHYMDGEHKRYPATVAAVAKIGEQPFIVAGTQPSYQRLGKDGQIVRKRPSSPAPQDFEYVKRMLDRAERLGLPAVLITDTLGAEPTLANEHRGQSRAIAEMIMRGLDYKHPIISVITGALGSGGGLATTPFSDHVIMLDGAMAFVAEPKSAASILYKTPAPTAEQVKTTVATMKPTAQDQLDFGLIDEVVPEGANPYITAQSLHSAILNAYVDLAKLSDRALSRRREKRIRNLRAFEIVQD